jgi:predicted DNA-binding WGR domain protein
MIESSLQPIHEQIVSIQQDVFKSETTSRIDDLEAIQQKMLAQWEQVNESNARVKKEFTQSEHLIEASLKRMSKDKREFTDRVNAITVTNQIFQTQITQIKAHLEKVFKNMHNLQEAMEIETCLQT